MSISFIHLVKSITMKHIINKLLVFLGLRSKPIILNESIEFIDECS
jgi:hypothetical protein